MLLAFVITIAVVTTTLTVMAIMIEKKEFNKGICPKCKNKLKLLGMGEQGEKGYVCDKCDYITWISYHCVDKNYKCEPLEDETPLQEG